MPVSADFHAFVLEQLGQVAPVTSRRMFGGVGYYADELFFALADDDTLYFKVDAVTQADFEAEGMKPFHPFGPDAAPMAYWEVPPKLLDSPEELAPWMRRALEVARRAAARKEKKPGTGRKRSPAKKKTPRKDQSRSK
jgi:DNA transformation protein